MVRLALDAVERMPDGCTNVGLVRLRKRVGGNLGAGRASGEAAARLIEGGVPPRHLARVEASRLIEAPGTISPPDLALPDDGPNLVGNPPALRPTTILFAEKTRDLRQLLHPPCVAAAWSRCDRKGLLMLGFQATPGIKVVVLERIERNPHATGDRRKSAPRRAAIRFPATCRVRMLIETRSWSALAGHGRPKRALARDRPGWKRPRQGAPAGRDVEPLSP